MGMDFSSIASPSALSILGSAGPIPQLMIGGVAATVAAAGFGYAAYRNYQEKKYKQKVETIIQLHKDKLETINLPGYGKITGFPPIFLLNKDGIYESLRYHLEEVKALGTEDQQYLDVELDGYTESIVSAINKLKEYYYILHKEDPDDVKIHILSYLLNVIQTKCFNFLGYDVDIAYIDAIADFINSYCSLGEAEHSQHYSRMKEVYSNLIDAKNKLKAHQQILSLKGTIVEFKNYCKKAAKDLLQMLVKMFISAKHFELADTVNPNELKEGLLRKKYIKAQLGGLVLRHDDEIKLPNSIFKTWVQNLATYFLNVVNFVNENASIEIAQYEQFTAFINKAKPYLAGKPKPPIHIGKGILDKLTRGLHLDDYSKKLKTYKDKHHEIVEQIQQIGEIFEDSKSYICTKYNPKKDKFEVVKSEEDIVFSIEIMANFAKMVDGYISLEYMHSQLSKSIKKLGEIYFENPAHFSRIFKAIEELGALVRFDLERCDKDFRMLEERNGNHMQLAPLNSFRLKIEGELKGLNLKLNKLEDKVKQCRKIAKLRVTSTVESTTQDMLEVVFKLLKRYKLPIPADVPPNVVVEANKAELTSIKPHPIPSPLPSPNASNPLLSPITIGPLAIGPVNVLSNAIHDEEIKTPRFIDEHPIPTTPKVKIAMLEHPAKGEATVPDTHLNQPHNPGEPSAPQPVLEIKIDTPAPRPEAGPEKDEARLYEGEVPLDDLDDTDSVPDTMSDDGSDDNDLLSPMNPNKAASPIFVTPDTTAATIPPMTSLTELLNRIEQTIQALEDEKEISHYTKIYNTLKSMEDKVIRLELEENKTRIRQHKIDKILALTLTLAEKTEHFINTNTDKRHSIETITAFNREIDELLHSRENSYLIDLHNNHVSRYIYSHICNFGIFRTDTRKKLSEFSEACHQLAVQ